MFGFCHGEEHSLTAFESKLHCLLRENAKNFRILHDSGGLYDLYLLL
jgi:hypothetical protein